MNSTKSKPLTVRMSLAPPGPARSMNRFTVAEGNFKELHLATVQNGHSGVLWEEGIRKGDNFLGCQVLILDVDGTWSLDEAKAEFKDTANVLITTSKSHQMCNKVDEYGAIGKAIKPADYFHIYLGLEEPITDKKEYLEVMSGLVNHYEVDKSVKDAGRFFFPNRKQTYWYS